MDVAKYRERYEAQLAKAAKSIGESAGPRLGEQDLDEEVEDLLADPPESRRIGRRSNGRAGRPRRTGFPRPALRAVPRRLQRGAP